MTRVNATPSAWYGGKVQLAPLIVSLLPDHTTFIEACGGMAAVIFAKPKSRLEVYNDLDAGLVGFFRVLRDPEQCAELRRRLDLTPYARDELRDAAGSWDAPDVMDDPIERARRWFVMVQMSFAGRVDRSVGWRFTTRPGHNPATSFRTATARLQLFSSRLAHVQVEHIDVRQLIRAYDGPDVCFYVDPPYVHGTRNRENGYRHELTDADHAELLDLLCACRGKVLLSGYDHPLYSRALAGWERIETTVACSAVGRTRQLGLKGAGAVYGAGQTRVECLWISPNALRQRRLFADGDIPTIIPVQQEVS